MMEEHTQSHGHALKRFSALISLVLISIVIALGAYTYTTVTDTPIVSDIPPTISVSGMGEVVARPDIAMFSFSVLAEAADPADAQEQSAEAINAITDYLKAQGIEEKDIKTLHYNLSPRYEYVNEEVCLEGFCPPGRQELVGYSVNQSIQVKIRDTEMAGDVIVGVGEHGATNISGISFTIDDEESLKAEAREKAIADAKAKAKKLADDLDVRIVRLTGFFEAGGGFFPHYEYGFADASVESMAVRATPSIPTGENTITSNVTITYEIR